MTESDAFGDAPPPADSPSPSPTRRPTPDESQASEQAPTARPTPDDTSPGSGPPASGGSWSMTPPPPPPVGVDDGGCVFCGAPLAGVSLAEHCPGCGTAMEHAVLGVPGIAGRRAQARRSNGLAIAALSTGVGGFALSCVVSPICFPIGVAAIPLGILCLRGTGDRAPTGGDRAMAITGIVTGTITGLLLIAALVFGAIFISQMPGGF